MKAFLKLSKTIKIISVLLIISAFFRFYLIDIIPCGLYLDQALNGLDALRLSSGYITPVFAGKEGLFIYFVAISHSIFGTGVWQIFIVSAFIGTLTIVTTYFAVREIFDRKVAFLSAYFLAVSSWHIALSRSGFRAILVPFVITLFFYFLAKVVKSKNKNSRSIYCCLTAGTFALGFYTYYAYVIFAFATLAIALFFAFKRKILFHDFMQKEIIIASLISFTLIILPIAHFVYVYPDEYFSRATDVSIFQEEKTKIEHINNFFQNSWQTLSGVFLKGDLNWRHNPSGNPLIHPVLSIFFFITLIYTIVKNKKLLLLFVILLTMSLPAILTDEGIPPHGLRLVGILPVLFVIPAISISLLLKTDKKKFRVIGLVVVALIIFVTTLSGYKEYFSRAPHSSHYYIDFRCDLTEAADYIQSNNDITVIADNFTFTTIRYLLFPDEVKHELPEDVIRNVYSTYSSDSNEIVMLSDYGTFNQELLHLLSEEYQKNEVKNKFGTVNYYIFTRIAQ